MSAPAAVVEPQTTSEVVSAGCRAAGPLISVVTPSYNQGRFIQHCIQSVLAQNYPNFEHIIYDNGSSDGTLDVLRRYPHLDWVSEADRGQSHALNKAIRKARGEIIAWINADDYYLPGAFDVAARELRRGTGVMVLQGRVQLADAAGRVLKTTAPHFRGHESLVDPWSQAHGLAQPGMFFRREALEHVGALDTRLHYAMDYDLWLRLTRHYPIKIVDQVVAGFRLHPESKTGQSRYLAGFRQELERVSRRYWGSVFTRRYWRLARACNRWTAEALTHAILDSHKHDATFQWGLVRELLGRRPQALGNQYLRVVLAERLGLRRVWDPRRRVIGCDLATRTACRSPARVLLANGRVTVVIPTYNRAALVQRAIQSVLQQTASSLCDIVVVDDGSTDITPQVLQRYASKVRYLRQLNAGVAAARNAALRGPCNEFVAFLDSDDEWAPHKLARQLDVLRRYPEAVLVATHGVRRAAGGLEWAPELPPVPSGRPVDLVPHLFGGAFLLTSGVVVRANSLPQRGPFSTNLRMCEDYLLWLQLACRGPAIVLAERLVTCGWNAPASLAADVARVREAQLRARYLAQWELRRRPDCAAAWREGLARLLAGQRDVALRAGQPSLAARLGFRSLMASPRGRALWEWGRLGHALLGCLVPSRRYG